MEQLRAVVTGAGTGIGLATTKKLIQLGFRVVGVGRRAPVLESAGEALGDDRSMFEPLNLDVTDKKAFKEAISEKGPIHTIVANAGVVRQSRLGDPGCDEVWDELLSINLDGVWNTLRAAVPLLINGGRIVMVSSGLGKLGRPGFSAYCASKHGMLGLMKCISKELAPREITVNAVCPGWVETEMARSDVERFAKDQGRPLGEIEEEIKSDIPLSRFVQPEEVADLICWLISKEASAITGQAYNISAGEFFA